MKRTSIINLGWRKALVNRRLAGTVKQIVGYQDEVVLEPDKPDSTSRTLLDISTIKMLAWLSNTRLLEDLSRSYEDVLQ